MKFDKTIFQNKLAAAPEAVSEFIISIDDNPEIESVFKKYVVDFNLAEDIRFQITLFMFGFSTREECIEELGSLPISEGKDIGQLWKEIEAVLSPMSAYIQTQQDTLRIENEKLTATDAAATSVDIIPANDALSHPDILSEIENPTPSFKSVSGAVSFSSVASDITADAEKKIPRIEQGPSTQLDVDSVLGTEASSEDPLHPAQPLSNKLDRALSTPTSSVPKEIYVSKAPDPYHEPIE